MQLSISSPIAIVLQIVTQLQLANLSKLSPTQNLPDCLRLATHLRTRRRGSFCQLFPDITVPIPGIFDQRFFLQIPTLAQISQKNGGQNRTQNLEGLKTVTISGMLFFCCAFLSGLIIIICKLATPRGPLESEREKKKAIHLDTFFFKFTKNYDHHGCFWLSDSRGTRGAASLQIIMIIPRRFFPLFWGAPHWFPSIQKSAPRVLFWQAENR